MAWLETSRPAPSRVDKIRASSGVVPPIYGRAGPGLGNAAAIVGSILGPLVEGGAAAYGVYAQSKQGKDELKQRKREFEVQQQLQREALEAQQKQFVLAQQAAIRQAELAQAYAASNWPTILGIVAIGAGALVLLGVVRAATKGRK